MKRLLFLYGMQCTVDVWDAVKGRLPDTDAVFAAYPREITQAAQTVSDITRWVYDTYGGQPFDAVIGHSLGGIIALELAATHAMDFYTVILIETNLRPAGAFYRNLMLPENMKKHGEQVTAMLRSEAPYYTGALKRSIQEGFDFTPFIYQCSAKLFALYGDRGHDGYEGRVKDLCLDKTTEEKIDFKFIPDACHMPMIENPGALAGALARCLLSL